MNKAELIMRRRSVRAFIDADKVSIVISRPGESTKNTNTGGYVKQPDIPLPPQTARIIQNVRRYTAGIVNSEAGDIPNTEYRLLGMHTLDVEKNDKFTWLGENYRVIGIHEARTESTYCAIQLLGGENRG